MIDYLIHNDMEADARLSDAMLYAALRQVLGDRLVPCDAHFHRPRENPAWGPSPYGSIIQRLEEARGPYLDMVVRRHLGEARLLMGCEVQAAMDRSTAAGLGVILRNMSDPVGRIRYCQPGDRYVQHASAIRAESCHPSGILVQPNFDLTHVRRYIVAGGEIAAESPYRHCEEEPLLLLDPENRMRQTRDFMSAFEPLNPDWSALQRAAAEALLADHALASGAIDVGIRHLADGRVEARVESVTAARPGAFAILFADPRAYAEKIAENLARIEPELDLEDTPLI